ncbi:hypothetical protein A2U01_0025187 [Trifolium medium]|uniref:Uncharacterized protein n=1 Tax=Trifolium medium TaxID=97028 RepID=A0A392NWF2_9FABA|nr:hypothetical protein [Trifolium medium]
MWHTSERWLNSKTGNDVSLRSKYSATVQQGCAGSYRGENLHLHRMNRNGRVIEPDAIPSHPKSVKHMYKGSSCKIQ